MANTIKLKRGSGSNPGSSDLSVGEVALRTDNATLFTKNDAGNIAEIGASSGVSDGDKGDITVSSSGSTWTIDSGVIDDANINASAAIAGTKISPNFGSQNITTTGNVNINSSQPRINLTDSNDNPNWSIINNDGILGIYDNTNGQYRLNVNTDGHVDVIGNLDVGAGIDVTGTVVADAFTGPLTGNVTGNASGSSGSCTGNAATATVLATARTIAGVSFDGSANISLNNNAITNGAGYITSADGGNAATLDGFDTSQNGGVSKVIVSKGDADVDIGANSRLIGQGVTLTGQTPGNFTRAVSGTSPVTLLVGNNTRTWAFQAHSTEFSIRDYTNVNVARLTIDTSGVISGNGSGLSSLNGSNISSGTVAAARVATLNQNTTGSAATLTTARTIGGTSFDGSANIDISYANLTNKLSVGDGGLTQNNFTNTLKSKLDGIESGATADQSAAEILTLIKTVDGAGSGLSADLLDGVQGSSYLRSDANDTMSSQLSLTRNGQYPLVIDGDHDGKIVLEGSNQPYIRWREGSTDKAYIQWGTDGYFYHWNSEHNRGLRIGSDVQFYDGSYRTIWHAGNDGSGSGLDADYLDGQHGSYYSNYNNLSNKPTIPTNNNQLSNGAGYITSASPPTTWNTVGTYAMAWYSGSIAVNGTLAGSNLNPASTGVYGAMFAQTASSGGTYYVSNANAAPCFYMSSTMSGTWRCMGNGRKSTSYTSTVTLWVRIS